MISMSWKITRMTHWFQKFTGNEDGAKFIHLKNRFFDADQSAGALMLRLIFAVFGFMAAAMPLSAGPTFAGLDRVDEFAALFAGKRVGLIVNQTSLNRNGEHITDIFLNMADVTVTALFGPEHGVRGRAADGVHVSDALDAAGKIPVYSLYGKTKKPTPEMLRQVDLLVFDMQDIGARFYTFIWTLYYAMQAAAENGIPIVVLDRPNPIGGRVEGPVLDAKFASFIGLEPLPVRHGMTIGELANMFNGEGRLGENLYADLEVVPMQNWRHDMWFDETGLTFTPPSPNMPDVQTAAVYPGLGLLEGTNVSEGRGTDAPFLTFGAPWIDAEALCKKLNDAGLPGLHFRPTSFTPRTIPGKAVHPKFENILCHGARVLVVDKRAIDAFFSGLVVIKTLHDMYADEFSFRVDGYFDLLCGTNVVRKAIESGVAVCEMEGLWSNELHRFNQLRAKYVLYPE